MLIDAAMTIAYKCASCGDFEFFSVPFFSFRAHQNLNYFCHCNQSGIHITQVTKNTSKIEFSCFDCENKHSFKMDNLEMLRGNIKKFVCPYTGITLCFAGKDEVVRKAVDQLEHELDHVMNRLGYEDYFVNTQVMYHSFNIIHDIAAQGNLICECGNEHIELSLRSDRILLKCKKCATKMSVFARTNWDLKNISSTQRLILSRHTQHVSEKNSDHLI